MQPLQIEEKAASQDTDLPCGEEDPVFSLQIGANLLALTIVNQALAADIDQHVVAHGATGQQQLGQLVRAPGNQSALLLASGSADIDGFPDAEGTMGQRFSAALNRLLHFHATVTDRAGGRGLPNYHANILQAVRLLPMAIVQGSDGGS